MELRRRVNSDVGRMNIMSANRRFIVGSLIGVALSALAGFLSAGDRGTYAPMIANSAFAMFFPGLVYTMIWFPVLLMTIVVPIAALISGRRSRRGDD